jgi:hypothetical protein
MRATQVFQMTVTTDTVTQCCISDALILQQHQNANLSFCIIFTHFDLCFFILLFVHSSVHLFVPLLFTVYLLTRLITCTPFIYLFTHVLLVEPKNRVLHPLAPDSCGAQHSILSYIVVGRSPYIISCCNVQCD